VAILVALAIAYGFVPKPVPVDLAEVRRGDMTVTIEEEGKTRVKDRYVITAPVAGYLRRIVVDVGDAVSKGQVLAELEPLRSTVLDPRSRAAAQAAVAAAEASLRAVEEDVSARSADAEYARANLERTRRLHEAGYASQDTLDQAESDAKRTAATLHSAEAAVAVARHQLVRARTELLYSPADETRHSGKTVAIRSPISGRVLKLHRESEGVANSGEPLIDVGDARKLEVEVEVLSADAVRIAPGTRVFFERWGGGPALPGSVRVVEPGGFTKISSLGVEEQRVLVIADFSGAPESWSSLSDRYRVEARFVIWEGAGVLMAPASALFRSGEGWAVFVVKGDRAWRRQVETGHRTAQSVEIVSGLEAGDIVITHPDDAIAEGVRVKARQ
jgi:HlyD family secretion protein